MYETLDLVPRHFFDGVISYMPMDAPASVHAAYTPEHQFPPLLSAEYDAARNLYVVRVAAQLMHPTGAEIADTPASAEFSEQQLRNHDFKAFALRDGARLVWRTVVDADDTTAVVDYLRVDIPAANLAEFVSPTNAALVRADSEKARDIRGTLRGALRGVSNLAQVVEITAKLFFHLNTADLTRLMQRFGGVDADKATQFSVLAADSMLVADIGQFVFSALY